MSMFIKRKSIIGECSDKNHQGCIDIKSISWGVNRQITSNTSTQGDRESSNATISDITITRRMDKATPYIFMEAACGAGKDLEIYLTKTGKGNGSDVFLVYVLKNAIFSHYNVTAKKKSQGLRPFEEIKVSFTAIEVKYIQYDDDNHPMAPIVVGFNTATNTIA